MTLAEQWKQEGFQQATHEIALKLLKFGMNDTQVAEATNIPIQEIQSIKKNMSH